MDTSTVISPFRRGLRRRSAGFVMTTTTALSMTSRNKEERSINKIKNMDDISSCRISSGGGSHQGYSMLRHYPLMCTLALSLVVLCTSEAFLSSTTPFLPPRGGATRSTSSSSSSSIRISNSVNTREGAIVATATTQRNLYLDDDLGGDELGGYSDVNADFYNLGVSSSSSPINGKHQPVLKKNGTKTTPNQIRLSNGSVVAKTSATRMPPVSSRNGFASLHSVSATAATLNKKMASTTVVAPRPPPSMDMANGVFIHKESLSLNGSTGRRSDVVSMDDDFVDHLMPAEFVAETDLPTDVGKFRLRAYRTDPDPVNEFTGREPTVIYAADKSPFGRDSGQLQENVPIRIHDQCLTSEVFRSQR
jgi:hypothetical protein